MKIALLMKSVYILRHGQTDYNKNGVLQGRTIDAPLNELGFKQSEAFYQAYRDEGFELIISSELKRSRQSIQCFKHAGIQHVVDERITEFSWGINEGTPLDEIVVHNYKLMLEKWGTGDLDARIHGGESGRELQKRVRSFVKDLIKRPESAILICTHGRTLKMLIVVLMGWEVPDMEKVRHSNAALFKLNQIDHRFEMELENDLSHLPPLLHQNAYWDK